MKFLMKLLIITTFVFISGCKQMDLLLFKNAQSADTGAVAPISEPVGKQEQTSPSLEPAPVFDINYVLSGFGGKHEAKMVAALELLSEVVKSPLFKEQVLNHTFNGKKTFYKNKGMSNQEVYELLLKGAETLSPEVDHEMDLNLTLYHAHNKTVGYTYPNTSEIWVNRKFFENYTLGEVANNAMHEWLHKIGFEHSFYNNSDRPFTVPYAIGEIVEAILNNSQNFR